MKSVLISIQPQWCELIASGKKTLEVRKTRPKLETPFKVYIYCTNGSPYLNRRNGICYLESRDMIGGRGPGIYERLSGKVIGEFVCDDIRCFDVPYPAFQKELDKTILEQSCCTYYALHRYAYHDALYGWHISDLQIYRKPKKLHEFKQCHKCPYGDFQNCLQHEYSCDGTYKLTRPPQSWCYVEDTDDGN